MKSHMNYQSAVFLTAIVTLILLDRFCDVMNPSIFTAIFFIVVIGAASTFLKYQRSAHRNRMRKDSSVRFTERAVLRKDSSVHSTRTTASTVATESSFLRGVSVSDISIVDGFTPRSVRGTFEGGSAWQEAFAVFAAMDEPSPHSCNGMLNHFTKARKTRFAIDLLDRMMSRGITPTPVGFHAALHICSYTKEWQAALALFRSSQDFGMDPSPVTYGIAINVMAKSNQTQRAFDMLDEMKRTVGPNGVALSASMKACIPTLDWRRALGFFQDISTYAIEPNIVAYGSIIDVLGKSGQWGLAMEYFNEMIRLNMRPNEVIYGSMVNFMAKSGQWRVALETYYQMDRDVGANEIALNSALRACNKDDHWERALRLLREFTAKTPNVTIKAYVAMLDVLAQCNQYKGSLELFEEISQAGYYPDIKCFNAVLSSFRALQWKMAVDFFERHENLGVHPDNLSYQVLIKSLVIAKQRDLTWHYFSQMVEAGISPTPHLSDCLARLCPHQEFRQVLNQLENSPRMRQKEYLPLLQRYVLSYSAKGWS